MVASLLLSEPKDRKTIATKEDAVRVLTLEDKLFGMVLKILLLSGHPLCL